MLLPVGALAAMALAALMIMATHATVARHDHAATRTGVPIGRTRRTHCRQVPKKPILVFTRISTSIAGWLPIKAAAVTRHKTEPCCHVDFACPH
jgi:hypothetical protein